MDRGGVAENDSARIDVVSPDGTPIAVWADGSGPPLVLVHGAMSDHTTYGPLVNELREHVATFAMDRRGRGASGDAGAYSIVREFEDVAAVVDAVAAGAGGPVALWGHSYGANCAMGGATLTKNVGRLILYEPGLGWAYRDGSIEAVEEAVEAGDMEAAIMALVVGILDYTDEEVEFLRSGPLWTARLAIVPTAPRELRAEEAWVYRNGQFDGIAAPTMVLAGSESSSEQAEATQRAAKAIPKAEIRVLEGHGHIAHQTDPAMIAGIIRVFVSS